MARIYKNVLTIGFLFISVIYLSGCGATKDLSVRGYMQDKLRVDQQIDGNSGYIAGTPVPEDRSEYKDTRKIYVLEVTKDAEPLPEGVDLNYEAPESADIPASNYSTQRTTRQRDPLDGVQIPSFDEYNEPDSPAYTGSGAFAEYTVEDGDTLQKISKRFYDAYSKWPRIYDANRNLLDSPHSIKPGMILRVPVEN